MKFRFHGVRICISLPFTALLAAMILLDKTGLLVPVFFAALAHELCHLFAMFACGVKPSSVRFCIGAVEIVRSNAVLTKEREIFISLSGPMINVVFGLALFGICTVTHCTVLGNYGMVQLAMGAFNLMPVMGLDGGTVVELLTGSRCIVLVTSAIIIVAGLVCLFLCRPSAGAGMFLSMLYICAVQLMCMRKREDPKRKRL